MGKGFEGSRLKIDRANEHLAEFYKKFAQFSSSDFYSLSIRKDPELHTSELCIDMDMAGLEIRKLGPIIGDIVHNLRSALDVLYEQVVLACGGTPSNYSRFPIYEFREKLENCFINSALKQGQIWPEIGRIIVEDIQPYKGGNDALWGLHELSILDKHKSLIPFIELVGFFGVRLENEEGTRFGVSEFIAEHSQRIMITGSYKENITLKNKGRASANVIFDKRVVSVRGETIYPTLLNTSQMVSGIIDAFDKIQF